jgi:hypothetical protein
LQPSDATPADSAGGAAPSDAMPLSIEPPGRAPVVHGLTTVSATHVFGVIVGVNDYPGTASDLRGSVNDALDMHDSLALYGVPEANVTTLLDGDASAAGISAALQQLVAEAGADSTVVLFFAGHVRKLGPDTEAFIAADGALLADQYLAHEIEGLAAHDVWIVMATCYGGGFTELLAPGRVLTAAADANSLAYENDSFGRSYLDEYLIHQGLLEARAAGPTAQQAYAYAQAGLQHDFPDRTLTEIDASTEMISLDGVHRANPDAKPPAGPAPGQPGAPPGPPPGPPPPTAPAPPPAPAPCRNPLGLLCPPPAR